MYTVLSGFIITGSNHSAAVLGSAYCNREASQSGVIAYFDSGIKTVAVAMDYLAGHPE
jgi:hypothetical protein